MTSAWACFGIWGPRSRDVLAPLTTQSLSNEEFPYMSAREITVGDVPVRALRVTYVGELGWELYCPAEYGMALWRTLWEAGEPHGLVAGGYRAIDSLRIEKGYRVWGADITPDETPYEGGLDFAVKLDKDFLGGMRSSRARPGKRLVCITLEDPRSVALGNEPVRVDGEIAGRVTTGGYGYTRRALDRVRVPAVRAGRARARRWSSTSSASGSRARSRRSRCSTRAATGYAAPREPALRRGLRRERCAAASVRGAAGSARATPPRSRPRCNAGSRRAG